MRVIPIDFSNFNPGTYQSQESEFGTPLTLNLTVGPVPEPTTLSLLALGGLATLLLFRRRCCNEKKWQIWANIGK
jgi:hypothetical protein